MSRMIPSFISPDVISRGEREIFELLQNSPETEDWIVLHSLNIPKHLARPNHEIDFVVLAPGYGVFCLEVKSGDIKCEGGVWIIKDRFGNEKRLAKSPMRQASEEMHTLMEKIKEKLGHSSRLGNILFSYGVIFPHVGFEVNDIETEKWRIYDKESVSSLSFTEFISRLSRNTARQLSSYSWFSEKNAIPDKQDIENLLNLLRPDFEFLITTPMRLNETEETINAFTQEQYYILDGVEPNDRVVFHGAAGTGKTVLAIESAKRSLCRPQRTLVLCFNKLLSSWIGHCLESFLYEDIGCVDAFCDYMESIVGKKQSGLLKDKAKEMHEEKMQDGANYLDVYYKELLPADALEKIKQGFVEKYDKIIIDEGQDIIRESYLDVIDALLAGGISGGKWEFYCDFEKQNIFLEDVDADKCLKLIKNYGKTEIFQFRLFKNCRNTKPIAAEIYDIFKTKNSDVLNANISGIPVKYVEYKTEQEQGIVLQNEINALRRQGITDEKITILSPHRLNHSCISRLYGQKIIDFTEDHLLFLNRDAITFGTIYKFKGMENSCIIITDISDTIDRKNFEDLLYVAMSRARFGLIVLIDQKVKQRLDNLRKYNG